MSLKKTVSLFILIVLSINPSKSQNTLTSLERSKEFTNKGWDLFEEQKYSEAISAFSKAIESDSKAINSYTGRANCYLYTNQYSKAQADVENALTLAEYQPGINFLAGNIYFEQKQYLKAIVQYTNTITNNKISSQPVDELNVHFNRGKAYLSIKSYYGAIDDFRKLIIKGDKSSEVYYNLAKGQQGIYELEKACLNYFIASELDSNLVDQLLILTCEEINSIPDSTALNKIKHLKDTSKVSDIVDINPMPKEGMANFYKNLGKNMRYPLDARMNRTQGKVSVVFIVNKDGSISNVRAINGISTSCDLEAIRVVEESPAWNPGMTNGKPVRVRMILPITFKL